MKSLLALSLLLAVPGRADVAATPAQPTGSSQAVIRALDGIVRLQASGTSTWTGVRKGALLRVGDTLHTMEGARAQLMMRGGGTITIGPLATLVIADPAVASASAEGGVKVRLKLLVGALFAKVHTEVTKEEFAIEMPGAVAAVKGCGFGLMVQPATLAKPAKPGSQFDEDAYLKPGPIKQIQLVTLEGLVKFSNNLGTQDVREGFTALIRPGAQPEPPATLDIHHAPLWLGPVASENGEQVVKLMITGADGVPREVTLRFAKQ